MLLILDYKKFLLYFTKYKIKHVFRRTNKVVDVLAKEERINLPSSLLPFILIDGLSLTQTRLVSSCNYATFQFIVVSFVDTSFRLILKFSH